MIGIKTQGYIIPHIQDVLVQIGKLKKYIGISPHVHAIAKKGNIIWPLPMRTSLYLPILLTDIV
jgi:hypothetical protein